MIKVTNLAAAIAAAYAQSTPQGMGFLHFREGPMDPKMLQQLEDEANALGRLRMDYVQGRAVKMTLSRVDGEWFADVDDDRWFDHQQYHIEEFKKAAGAEGATA